jgi:hypothetical protein
LSKRAAFLENLSRVVQEVSMIPATKKRQKRAFDKNRTKAEGGRRTVEGILVEEFF